MNAIVCDDEAPARRRLTRLLLAQPGVKVVAEVDGAEALLAVLRNTQVDVLFLDIRMPGLDGLTLARSVPLPPLVFTTAFAEHAVDAFEVRAVDYLLKPVLAARLVVALERVREHLVAQGSVGPLLQTLAQVTPVTTAVPRVTATKGGETRIFDARELAHFWASEKYSCFCAQGKEYETEESLLSLEARLAPHGFVRAHRGALVNLSHVRTLRRSAAGLALELADGQEVSVSRRQAVLVRTRLGL